MCQADQQLPLWVGLLVLTSTKNDKKAVTEAESLIARAELQKGLKKGQVNLILRLLSKRFGPLEEGSKETVGKLSAPLLEALGEALLDFSDLSDLQVWLESHADYSA